LQKNPSSVRRSFPRFVSTQVDSALCVAQRLVLVGEVPGGPGGIERLLAAQLEQIRLEDRGPFFVFAVLQPGDLQSNPIDLAVVV